MTPVTCVPCPPPLWFSGSRHVQEACCKDKWNTSNALRPELACAGLECPNIWLIPGLTKAHLFCSWLRPYSMCSLPILPFPLLRGGHLEEKISLILSYVILKSNKMWKYDYYGRNYFNLLMEKKLNNSENFLDWVMLISTKLLLIHDIHGATAHLVLEDKD